jgi:hypothetical protein
VTLALDHLVVAARTLDEGAAWCGQTLGIVPGEGGMHAFMGTHNRLFSIASTQFPRAYFEIIAIDPQARAPGRKRWFDLDSPALQEALRHGPRLIHWVARCDDIGARVAALARQGHDVGAVLHAERETPSGMLRWRITVREDGARLAQGAWPTLIQWGDVHPADTMPHSGVRLVQFGAHGLPAGLSAALPAEYRSQSAPPQVEATCGAIHATLHTPRGLVTLQSSEGGIHQHVQR